MKKKISLPLAAAILIGVILFVLPFIASTRKQENGGRIAGRVIDRDSGRPLEAELGIVLRGKGGITVRHVRTSDQGQFEITGLGAGEALLTTKLTGYAAEKQTLSITPAESLPVEFRLVKSGIVRGGIFDREGAPIADSQVRVIYADDSAARGAITAAYQWEMGEVRTDHAGQFTLEVHPEKEFVIEANHPQFLGDISSPMQMAAAENRAQLRISLSRGERVEGEIRDVAGNLVPGAEVRIAAGDERPELGGFVSFELLRQRTMTTVSDETGRYRFDRVSTAARQLIISHPKYRPLRRDLPPGSGRMLEPAILELKGIQER